MAMTLANYIIIMTPALANIITRLITKEGWGQLWLRPNLRRGWRFYLAAWFLPLVAVAVGAATYYLLYPQTFDASLAAVQTLFASAPAGTAANPWPAFLFLILQSAIVAVPINALVSMGEEFGWRAYLLQKLMARFTGAGQPGDPAQASAAAARKASLLVGLVWGVWHWPLIFMSISIDPTTPLLYPLIYLLSTCAMSVLLCWVTLRSGSAWPAAVGHGAINAFSGLAALTMKGPANMLLGPMTGSLIGSAGFFLLALALLMNRNAFAMGSEARSGQVSAVVRGE
jgi:membrane protease YdiL (CAAX protease family)